MPSSLMSDGVVAAVRNDSIQRHIPGLGLKLRDALKLVGDADEFRPSPAPLSPQMMQATIIEARAAAKSCTAAIDRDERHQDQIKFSNGDALHPARIGLRDAECIEAQLRMRIKAQEVHAMVATMSNCRQVNAAAALPRQCDHA